MTRERISEGLMLLVMLLANGTSLDPPAGWESHEWAYVKGLASNEILRLRHLLAAIEGP